jgi:hypothetical protein
VVEIGDFFRFLLMNWKSLCLVALVLLSGCDQTPAPVPVEQAESVPAAPPPVPVEIAAATRTNVAPQRPPSAGKPLDLHLPEELLQPLSQADFPEAAALLPPLLPPLFKAKPSEPKPFQLQGQLFIDERDEKMGLQALDGVQLQLKIRQ